MTDFCVLIATHGVAAKSIDTDGRKITTYDLAPRGPRNFRYEEHHVDGFEEAVAFLEILQRETQKFLIRGVPTSYAAEQQAAGQLLYRRKRADEEAPATFKAVDRDWVMLDIDGLAPPPGVCPTSDEALSYAISQLPPEFHDLSMWYQFSSSAHPSQSVIKVHFMALLDRPISDAALRETARAWNLELGSKLIDEALFDPIQIHYVAAPIISNGPDFLGSRRSGVIRGSRDRAQLVLRKSRGDNLRPGLGLSIGGESVEYDDAGKAVDGREGLLLRIRLAVLIEKHQPQTFEEFVHLVWDRFIGKRSAAATVVMG